MSDQKTHIGWLVEDLVADPVGQLGARWAFIHGARKANETATFEQALETLAVQMFAGKMLLEESTLIARFLAERRPTKFRLGLLSALAALRGDPELSQRWAEQRDALPITDADRASDALQKLGDDPNWKSLSKEEKRLRFVEAGLIEDKHGT